MSKYIDLTNAPRKEARTGTMRWVSIKAATEPLVMLEMLVAKYLESKADNVGEVPTNGKKHSPMHPTARPLSIISIFKYSLKSEESISRFDLLTLNQRCVELLRKVNAVCVEQSPLDYLMEKYGGDRQLNSCVSHMMAGVLSLQRHQPTRFQEACLFVKEVVEAAGDAEYG